MDERLRRFYDEALDAYGPDDPRALRWTGPHSQIERFRALSEVGDLEGASVLDVGCGVGDLYGFLSETYTLRSYTGLDINPRFIAAARGKYPDAQFAEADFASYAGAPVDWVLASGALTFVIPNHREVYFGFIRKMFAQAKKGIAFNMLDSRTHINDDTYAAYSPVDVYHFCLGLTPRLVLRQDYLPQDFTVYLYH